MKFVFAGISAGRVIAAPLVLVMGATAMLLIGGAALATPAPGTLGTLTFIPPSGLDTTIITVHTSAGCDPRSTAAYTDITGPVGTAKPIFPPSNPFTITTSQNNAFSTTGPFDIPDGLSMAQVVQATGKPLPVGEYDFTVHCVDQDFLTEFGTFTGAIYFTDSRHYTSTPATPNPTPPPTSMPIPTPTPTPLPNLGTLNFIPSSGLDTTIITVHTSAGCDPRSTAAYTNVTGPVGDTDPIFQPSNPLTITTSQNNAFSTTEPFDIPDGLSMADGAESRFGALRAGEYDFTVHCVDQDFLTEFGTFTGAIYFTDPTHYTSTPPSSPTPSPGPATPVPTLTPTPVVTAMPTPALGTIATTIRMSVIPVPLPLGLGGLVILTANVSPFPAAGTVQFTDSTTNLGKPVPVNYGLAVRLTALPAGTHSITAVFTPTNPAKLKPSTSNIVTVKF